MTDEEKAIKDLCIKCSSYDFCVKGNQLHCAETVAYIKGLAEGKPKWHDLRKNPNDLPKETGPYLTDDGNTYIYDTDCKKWRTPRCMVCWDFNWLDDGDIVAWCELPKFEEKK